MNTRSSFFILGLFISAPSIAQQILPSNQAFSGLIFTPNAQVMAVDDFSLTFAQGLPHQNQIAELDSIKFGLGVFQGLEANGRIVTKTYNANLYIDKTGGIRDLSASIKYQLPQIWSEWGALKGLNIALGIQDIGGAASHFDASYVVADYSFSALPIRASVGYGRSDLQPQVLNGVFAGIEYQPLEFVQLVAEHDGVATNAMAKVFTPDGLLPWGVTASLGVQLYTSHENSEQTVWQSHVNIPVVSDYQKKSTQLRQQLTLQDKLHIELTRNSSASLNQLRQALVEEGFLNVQLGRQDDHLIVTLENRRYNRNQVDGLGVALGIIASHYHADAAMELGLENDDFALVALQHSVPVMQIISSASCYREFITQNIPCAQLNFTSNNQYHSLDKVEWLGSKERNGFGRTQVILSPNLRYNIATEYGVLDYSAALAVNTYTSLWSGAALDIRYQTPLDNSDDYDHGLWRESAFKSEFDRIQFHQLFQLPLNLAYQFSYGRVYKDYQGMKNLLAWSSPTGRHAFMFDYSRYQHIDTYDRQGHRYQTKDTKLASYLFSLPELNWQLEVQGGDFWNGDQGIQVTSNHWFGDLNVYARYLASKFESQETEQFVTLGVSFPLTFWRDTSPGYIQPRGIDQFELSIQTRVGETHNNLNAGSGGTVPFQHNWLREYQNRGRFGEVYYQNQTTRLRNAYLRWIDSQ
ncbi:YjbH domain-containing protein [Vibrio metschnikovii]|uniref:YjbH domain-containing protein n=1 Tax=Vibrio metschnikovii TaxID=28172 RepID=UPI001C3113FE|nr:YjbH domain-containing protein [Vibrio metschnikovii]